MCRCLSYGFNPWPHFIFPTHQEEFLNNAVTINHVRRRLTAVTAKTLIETAEVPNVSHHSSLKVNSIPSPNKDKILYRWLLTKWSSYREMKDNTPGIQTIIVIIIMITLVILDNTIVQCRVIRTLTVVKIWIEWLACYMLMTFSLYVIYSERVVFAVGEYSKL